MIICRAQPPDVRPFRLSQRRLDVAGQRIQRRPLLCCIRSAVNRGGHGNRCGGSDLRLVAPTLSRGRGMQRRTEHRGRPDHWVRVCRLNDSWPFRPFRHAGRLLKNICVGSPASQMHPRGGFLGCAGSNVLDLIGRSEDSNLRPPVPQTGALTGLRYAPTENPLRRRSGACKAAGRARLRSPGETVARLKRARRGDQTPQHAEQATPAIAVRTIRSRWLADGVVRNVKASTSAP